MDLFGENWLASRLLLMIPVLLSLTVHEWAHAWTAYRLGDDTAARLGRLTLNPIPHIDPIGLLLPLMGVPFGWAKPVPVNMGRFRPDVNLRHGLVLTAAAGPISNLILAVGATVALAVAVRLDVVAPAGAAYALVNVFVLINVVLALFNMLPVPPLDGSRVMDGLCPDALRPAWNAFARIGPMGLVVVILAPLLLGVSVIGVPLRHARILLDELFRALAGV